MSVLPFRRRRSISKPSEISTTHKPRATWRLQSNSTRLSGKLQRLAWDDPDALALLEQIVDDWLRNSRNTLSL